jgi:hypothetical protein
MYDLHDMQNMHKKLVMQNMCKVQSVNEHAQYSKYADYTTKICKEKCKIICKNMQNMSENMQKNLSDRQNLYKMLSLLYCAEC